MNYLYFTTVGHLFTTSFFCCSINIYSDWSEERDRCCEADDSEGRHAGSLPVVGGDGEEVPSPGSVSKG